MNSNRLCTSRLVLLVAVVSFPHQAEATPQSVAAKEKFFESEVRPLLVENCYQCHSAQADTPFANLRLDNRAGMLKGGDRGPVIVPGDPDASQLIQAVRYRNLEMPPTGKLSGDQIEVLVKWVRLGAPWPEHEAATGNLVGAKPDTSEASLDHWAWQSVSGAAPPAVRKNGWPSHPIDHFILAQLEAKGLKPSPGANRYTLLRRIYFDLTGLPPDPQAIQAFVRDDSEHAFERVVDRLLASPDFGERWGRHWLDLTGYADTLGKGRRIPAKEAWRYRDYVIQSLNSDKPYDRFVREQIAGDVLDWQTDAQRRQQIVATGFLAIGPWALVDADKEQLTMDVVDTQIDRLGRVFQGLTLGCARCHDHKFDPIPTNDYYAMAGIFRSTRTLNGRKTGIFSEVNRVLLPETAAELRQRSAAMKRYQKDLAEAVANQEALKAEEKRLADRRKALQEATDSTKKEQLEKEIEEIEKTLKQAAQQVLLVEFNRPGPPLAIATEDRDVPEDCHLNIRGNPHSLGESVPRGFLSLTSTGPPRIANRRDFKGRYVRSSGRLELAAWLVDPRNPLTARVMVNRIWHHLLGVGLVRTVDNFGTQGEAPSHPELLDYLASRFVQQGWSVKSMIREIVLTSSYRQSSNHNAEAHATDPDNRLLWRANRRRLEAETLRDSMLAISGRLDRTRGGPSLPLDSLENIGFGFPEALAKDAKIGEDVLWRRTVYLPTVRKSQLQQLELLDLFDFPNPDETTGARSVTTVPTQGLYLMNSPFVMQQALLTAKALLNKKELDDSQRIAHLFLRVLNRPVTHPEVSRALEFLARFERDLAVLRPDEPRREAWSRYCHAVLVSNEFLFRG